MDECSMVALECTPDRDLLLIEIPVSLNEKVHWNAFLIRNALSYSGDVFYVNCGGNILCTPYLSIDLAKLLSVQVGKLVTS